MLDRLKTCSAPKVAQTPKQATGLIHALALVVVICLELHLQRHLAVYPLAQECKLTRDKYTVQHLQTHMEVASERELRPLLLRNEARTKVTSDITHQET